MSEKICVFCGQSGHRAHKCTKRPVWLTSELGPIDYGVHCAEVAVERERAALLRKFDGYEPADRVASLRWRVRELEAQVAALQEELGRFVIPKPGGGGVAYNLQRDLADEQIRARLIALGWRPPLATPAQARDLVAEWRALHLQQPAGAECWCASCDRAQHAFPSRMSVCPECGDKRCPRAADHLNDCHVVDPEWRPDEQVDERAGMPVITDPTAIERAFRADDNEGRA